MGRRNGRRERRKRRRDSCNAVDPTVNLSNDSLYVELRKWLKKQGFNSKSLIPTRFTDTGRGLMTTETIPPGGLVVSVPERCLITSQTVLSSYLGEYIKRWKPPVSPVLALCIFLISERHLGAKSQWKPYVDVLPETYTCPVYFCEDAVSLLPGDLREKAMDQRRSVSDLYRASQPFFRSLQPLFRRPVEDIFTRDALQWAWCSVNTRTVYMEQPQSPFLSHERDVYALAPYLDLLNHCPTVQVDGGFSLETRCYELCCRQGCGKFQQAFICYGPHDNQRLLLEYGFVAPGNPHSVVYVDPGDLDLCLCGEVQQFAQKLMFLKQRDFLTQKPDLRAGWRLLEVDDCAEVTVPQIRPIVSSAALVLIQYYRGLPCWKAVLLGAAVSQDQEKSAVRWARLLCRHLREENAGALLRLSVLRQDSGATEREHLTLVESLRLEAQGILGYSEDLLQNLQEEAPPTDAFPPAGDCA